MVAANLLPATKAVGHPVVVTTMPASVCATPDPSPILAIHRGCDGFINFRTEGHRDDIFSIPAGYLREMFPAIRSHLSRDAYFSLNGFFRPGHGSSRHVRELPAVRRDSESLRYLNACFIDLDAHNDGLTQGDVVGRVHDAVQAGVDQGYFQFDSTGGSSTTTLSGQTLVNCSVGDAISLNNVSGFSFTYGNNMPTNVPSATLTILQIH